MRHHGIKLIKEQDGRSCSFRCTENLTNLFLSAVYPLASDVIRYDLDKVHPHFICHSLSKEGLTTTRRAKKRMLGETIPNALAHSRFFSTFMNPSVTSSLSSSMPATSLKPNLFFVGSLSSHLDAADMGVTFRSFSFEDARFPFIRRNHSFSFCLTSIINSFNVLS